MKKSVIAMAALLLALGADSAMAQRRGRVIIGGPGFGGFYGSGFYGRGFGPGFGPGWGPGWGSAYFPGYGPTIGYSYPNTGNLRIDTRVKDAEVYIDGAFAGLVRDSRNLRLRPGSYSVEVRYAGRVAMSERVYIAAGRTLKLRPAL